MWKPDSDNQTLPRGVICRDSKKKNNIQGDIKILQGRGCEVEKVVRFLRDLEIFEEI